MALFGSSEKTTSTSLSKKIRPTVMRVQNVAKELLAIAQSNNVKVDTIDFNILEIQTYTRMNDGVKETEWEEISKDEIYELDDASALLNPYFQMKQMYEVEFFTKKENSTYENFRLAIGANATKCKVYLSIKEGSEITYNDRLSKELELMINKHKVRVGILIHIFDEMLGEAISKFIAQVRVEETIKYDKNETILIAESYEPTWTVNDKLIMHYDKEEKTDDHHKIDYASRGFIKAVKKDEILIEYIKAQTGKPGRNCRGEFMAPKEVEEVNLPTFTVDETIREDDTQKSIKYIANENGYISFENNVYAIKTEVDMGEISFKTTGNITSGLDSDVNINVSEKDVIKDAIGMGMEVEVTEIEIEGNVGSNAKLRAIKASISGQTHKTAEIRADKLKINVHKGSAYGKQIHITRLEHGIVDGDIVNVSQALGGEIRAKEISIEICASHVKATASKFIEIAKLQGSENTFTIDPLLKKSAKAGLDENKDEIKNLKFEVQSTRKDVEKYTDLIKGGTASFNDIKKRLIYYKKNAIKMPDSFVRKYKQFQKMQEHLKSLEGALKFKKGELEILRSKTSIFQDNIMDARIINRDRWVGYNELIFKMIEPTVDLSYKPKEGSAGKVFGLVKVDEGEFEIQVLDD
ncbi:MAG: hypothetical protein ACI9TV_001577 [Sulfurimonas sp.]|jgi:hypothetical protein|uniref:flagellar assembly protein A n=1 Tax=Sulfurimonas sp. TaxID=2022749 RepID=UPI0039E6E368